MKLSNVNISSHVISKLQCKQIWFAGVSIERQPTVYVPLVTIIQKDPLPTHSAQWWSVSEIIPVNATTTGDTTVIYLAWSPPGGWRSVEVHSSQQGREDLRVSRNDPWRNPSLRFLFLSEHSWNYSDLNCRQLAGQENEFHLSMTLSAKKNTYFLRSNRQRCLANLRLWPLVWQLLLTSKNESNLRNYCWCCCCRCR